MDNRARQRDLELSLGQVTVASKKIPFKKGDTTVRQLRGDVAAFVIPLQCYIGKGGARKAVCAARGSGLVGVIGCRGLRLFGGSTSSCMMPSKSMCDV